MNNKLLICRKCYSQLFNIIYVDSYLKIKCKKCNTINYSVLEYFLPKEKLIEILKNKKCKNIV